MRALLWRVVALALECYCSGDWCAAGNQARRGQRCTSSRRADFQRATTPAIPSLNNQTNANQSLYTEAIADRPPTPTPQQHLPKRISEHPITDTMSAQNTDTSMTGGDATLDKGKGKAAEPTREDVSMGEEDSSDEESGAEEQVSPMSSLAANARIS